jgi:hypothetical protein
MASPSIHNADRFRQPHFRVLGYLVLLGLLLLAGVFYRERALFIDVAFQTFLMITEGTVQVMVHRFGAAIVQALPWAAIQLEWPLWMVSLTYSLSFPLLFLFFYFLIVRVFRNDYLGWVLVFLFTLIVHDAFYWVASEYQQGLAFLLVFFAFVRRYPALDRWWMWLFLVPATVALAYYHPLVFVVFFYCWLFFLVHGREHRHWRYYLSAALMVVVVVIKSRISANWYDGAKYDTFFQNLMEYFPNYFDFESHRKFLANCFEVWYFFPVFLLAAGIFYIIRRQWMKLALLLGYCFGYLMLVHIGSPNAAYRFYVEVNYMALAVFVALPFVYDVVPAIRRPRLVFFLFMAISALRLAAIYRNHEPFTQRLEWLAGQLDKGAARHQSNRLWLSQAEAPMDTLLMTWGVAYETLLLSAMKYPDSAKTLVILPDPARFETELNSPDFFISDLKSYPVKEVEGRYFRLGRGRYVAVAVGSSSGQ